QVDHELIFRRLLEWQVSRIFAVQDAIDVAACLAIQILAIDAVERQAAAPDINQVGIDREHAALSNQFDDLLSHRQNGYVGQEKDRRIGPLGERSNGAIDIGDAMDLENEWSRPKPP